MRKRVRRLQLESQDIPLNFSCIGIVSPLKPHKMAWSVNMCLQIQLFRQEDRLFQEQKSSSLRLFAHYAYEKAQDIYRLLYNRLERKDQTKCVFIKEWATFDYLLLLRIVDLEKSKLEQQLRNIRGLQYTETLNPNSLKNKSWLIL